MIGPFGMLLGSTQTPARARMSNGGPELLLQAEILHRGDKTSEGVLVRSVGFLWLEICERLNRDPQFLYEFVKYPRKFEEFIAACYERDGFEVVLTPQHGDRGRDVIATRGRWGSVRFLDQTKAYSPGRLVTHDDVRAMVGTLGLDQNASKALITTTSNFEPGVLRKNSEFSGLIPHRLELKNGADTLEWIKSISQTDRAHARGQSGTS